MMLLQAVRRDAAGAEHDLLDSPTLAEAGRRLDGGTDDFAGRAAFSFGGAILLPYAGRIPGRALSDSALQADLGGQTARLPRNGGGQAAGATAYAIHGLILDLTFEDVLQDAVASALERWGRDMITAKKNGVRASVEFRFTTRQDDATTAFEAGAFRYATTDKAGVSTPGYVRFEALLVKSAGGWQIVMERQLDAITEQAWNSLPH